MSVIKYSFNTQLSILCRSLSYLAFGIKIPISSPLLSLNLTYKSDIAQNVYEKYRQDEFKYADQGITPKAIAQQMLVHLKYKGDLEWKIDQFGCFLFRPTPVYQDRLRKMLIKTGRYEHQSLLEAQDSIRKQQRQTYYIDYYIDNKTTLSELRRLVHLQCKARVLQQVNKYEVYRTIYTESLSSQSFQIIKNMQPILFKIKNLKIMPLSYLIQQNKGLNLQIDNNFDLENKKIRYFACNGQQTINFQKLLPRHKLLNIYTGNEQIKIINLRQQDLLKNLKNLPKGLKKKNLFKMEPSQKINIEDLIIIYGNLIDMHNFSAVQELLDKFEVQFQGVQQYKIIRDSYDHLTKNNSNL